MYATINLTINDIGTNMTTSNALKWVLTSGTSTNIINVLASGNFNGTSIGSQIALKDLIEVTTTTEYYTVWIWLDGSEEISSELTGETLDTYVWTQVDQLDSILANEPFVITTLNNNYQYINATVLNRDNNITDYAIVNTNSCTNASWNNISETEQDTTFILENIPIVTNATNSDKGTYYVCFKDVTDNTVISEAIEVDEITTTAPNCTWGNFDKNTIVDGDTANIELTCIDNYGITTNDLTSSDITLSNASLISIESMTKTTVTNGWKYSITVKGNTDTGNGSTTLSLTANKVLNKGGYGNNLISSSNLNIVNTVTLTPVLNCVNKVYDGNTSAICTISLSNKAESDNVSATGTCAFNDATIGNDKTITCSNITLSGSDTIKYKLESTTATGTANIAETGETYTATFYYNSGTDGELNISTTTSSCTVTSGSTCIIPVPSVVSNSTGVHGSAYSGAATETDSLTSNNLEVYNNDMVFYAYYSSPVTIYYPTSTTTCGNTTLYRNEWLISSTSMSSSINSNLSLNNISALPEFYGTLEGISTSNNTNIYSFLLADLSTDNRSTYYGINNHGEIITLTYNYYNGSEWTTTTNTGVRTNYGYCANTTTATSSLKADSNVTVSSTVTNSVGPYGTTYKGVSTINESMTTVTPNTSTTIYYAVYSSDVTLNYYDNTNSEYTTKTLYRNAMQNSTVLTGTASGISNYSTAGGPNSSTWAGLSTEQDEVAEYATVAEAATSTSTTLYTVYNYAVTYSIGSNVSSIGQSSDACNFAYNEYECEVTLPSITAASGYSAIGWNTSSGTTIGISAGDILILDSNNLVYYANAMTSAAGTYSYSGAEETFDTTISGYYKLEVWGANGGKANSVLGGYGGYSVGVVLLKDGDILYINVGGSGTNGVKTASKTTAGGYNGGGNGYSYTSSGRYFGGGGGATHIATVSGLLKNLSGNLDDILIVAGGGGGAVYRSSSYTGTTKTGSGGGYIGVTGQGNSNGTAKTAAGGTQTSGYAFGQGASGSASTTQRSGGGGGLYGGAMTAWSNGGGGSGYIGNSLLLSYGDVTKAMYCYNCTTSSDASTKTVSTTSTGAAVANKANTGAGVAKITFLAPYYEIVVTATGDFKAINTSFKISSGTIMTAYCVSTSSSSCSSEWQSVDYPNIAEETKSITIKDLIPGSYYVLAKDSQGNIYTSDAVTVTNEENYSYTGAEQTLSVPATGYYQLETWGAQGGLGYSTYIGGYGGYSTGAVCLNQNDTIYINVGGQGTAGVTTASTATAGGYNGGGDGYNYTSTKRYVGGGGGATHIATTTGLLSTLSSKLDNILIVSGGGGGGAYYSANYYSTIGTGSGGGYVGVTGTGYSNGTAATATGGTQTSGYAFGQGASGSSTSTTTAGAGGGLYGGTASTWSNGGGGSGYIGNSRLQSYDTVTKTMYCYNCDESSDANTKTVTTSNTGEHISNYANTGDGYATIKFLAYENNSLTITRNDDGIYAINVTVNVPCGTTVTSYCISTSNSSCTSSWTTSTLVGNGSLNIYSEDFSTSGIYYVLVKDSNNSIYASEALTIIKKLSLQLFTTSDSTSGNNTATASVDLPVTPDNIPTITVPSSQEADEELVFGGYYTGIGGTGEVAYDTTGVGVADTLNSLTANATLYSYWRYPLITFDKQGGTGGTDSIIIKNGDSFPTISIPTKGYSFTIDDVRTDYDSVYYFAGYYTGTNGTGTQIYNADGIQVYNANDIANGPSTYTQDVTLYAYWQPYLSIHLIDNRNSNNINVITHSATTLQNFATIDFRYQGSGVNNYVKLDNSDKLWRIIGAFRSGDSDDDNYYVKIISDEIYTGIEMYSSCKSTCKCLQDGLFWAKTETNYYGTSTIGNFFNSTISSGASFVLGNTTRTYGYLSGADSPDYIFTLSSTAKSMLQTNFTYYTSSGWNVENPEKTASEWYIQERSNTLTNNSSSLGTWSGTIGLMYVSDYYYASSACANTTISTSATYVDDCKNTNWLYNSNYNYEWTITPSALAKSRIFILKNWVAYYSGASGTGSAYYDQLYARPVAYLKYNVVKTGGTGTSTDPYTISLN